MKIFKSKIIFINNKFKIIMILVVQIINSRILI